MPYASTIDTVSELVEEYAADGLKLTLRQLYYQFVARGLCANGTREYKRLGVIATKARYQGDLAPDALEDRGRSVSSDHATTDQTNPHGALNDVANFIRTADQRYLWRSRWWAQPTHVSVWVEKDALAGVFEPLCLELGVSFSACRGYPSVSMLNDWLNMAVSVELQRPRREHVVLYFGDHDPDGMAIPHAAEDGIHKLALVQAREGGFDVGYDIANKLRFERVALNMDQIKRHKPPPFAAKMTSSRFAGYVKAHKTRDAWELDALDPRTLRDLVRTEVEALYDADIAARNDAKVRDARRELRDLMTFEWFKGLT